MGVEGPLISLRRTDDERVLRIRKDQLSEEDQSYLREHHFCGSTIFTGARFLREHHLYGSTIERRRSMRRRGAPQRFSNRESYVLKYLLTSSG